MKIWRSIPVAIVIDHAYESQLQDSLSELLLVPDMRLASSSGLIFEALKSLSLHEHKLWLCCL
jgi:hypothetical protein